MKERAIKIFRKFISSDIPILLDSLSDELHISSRTLRNDINEINLYLKGRNLPLIKNIRGKGFLLKLSNSQKQLLHKFNEGKNESVYLSREERIFDLILSFSLSGEKNFLYQKEEEFQVSKSTLDEDMRRVRLVLKGYGIEVLSLPKQGTILKGKERSIRTMIYDVINRFVGFMSFPKQPIKETINESILYKYIPRSTFTKLDQIYDDFISSVEENMYRNQMILFTSIWLSRYSKQNIIASNTWGNIDTPQNDIKSFIQIVCKKFDIQPLEIEIKYIIFMLETFNSRDMNNSIEWVNAQLLSIQLIQHVEKETKIPFSLKEEELQEGLYKHIAGLINRVKSDIQVMNPLKENVQHNYRNIYKAIENFAPLIEESIGKKMTEDEIAFLTIHFSTSVSEIKQNLKYAYKAVVICNHGVVTGKLLAEKLKELFSIDILAVLSSKEIDLINKLDVDVVFSTLNIDYIEKPMLVLEPIIKKNDIEIIEEFLRRNQQHKRLVANREDSTDLFYSIINVIEESGGKVNQQIYKKVEEIFNTNQLKLNKKEIQPMLEDVLKDSDIILCEQVQDWRDAIRKVSIPLLKDDVIEKRYIENMIESVEEFGPYIVIGKHLALAHARPEDGVKKLGISVATLKKPIEFGNEDNDPVKIVFCLAAIDSYSHLNIMKNLIDLINEGGKIDRLVECKNIKEFKEVLYAKAI